MRRVCGRYGQAISYRFWVDCCAVGGFGLALLLSDGGEGRLSAGQIAADDAVDAAEAPPDGWVDPPLDDLPLRRLREPQLGSPRLPARPPAVSGGSSPASPSGPAIDAPPPVTGRAFGSGPTCQTTVSGSGAAHSSGQPGDSADRGVGEGSERSPARRQLVSLGPPRMTYSAVAVASSGGPLLTSGVSSAGWSEPPRGVVQPVAARGSAATAGAGDPESLRAPTLPLDGTIQAVYQSQPVTARYLAEPQDMPNYTLPPTSSGGAMAAPPSWSAPSEGPPVLPPGSGSGGASPPRSTPPGNSAPPGVMPPSGGPSAAASGALPTYPQPAPIVTGAPFVGQPGCQFDGYQRLMVVPAAYAQGSQAGCLPGGYAAPAGYSMGPQGMAPQGVAGPATGTGGSVIMPSAAPQLYSQNNAGWRPLFTLGQENYNVQLGRGIIGQPTVYVTGQPFRNFLRYLFP